MNLPIRSPYATIVAILSAGALNAPFAHAALYSTAYEAQLEGWLGLGDVTFTSIYYQAGTGMSNAGFHAAADGQGETITLLNVGAYNNEWNTPNQIIGGYNPQSWNSSSLYNYTNNDADRTAFLFNLTDDVVQRQKLSSQAYGSYGVYQTYNSSDRGPSFGGGHDLYANLSGSNAFGYAYNYSFGGTSFLDPITSGATDSYSYMDYFRISEIEVLTFSRVPNNVSIVPEPGNVASLMALLSCSFFLRSRRARAA